MVAGRCREYPRAVIHPATLGIIGTEHQARDAKEGRRLGAHRAGFQRHGQGAVGQSGLTQALGGFTQSEHFGVGGRVMARFYLIPGPRQHLARLVSHDSTYRHFATRGSGAGFFQGDFHRRHHAFLPRPGVLVQGQWLLGMGRIGFLILVNT
jgi:hypothetical protein